MTVLWCGQERGERCSESFRLDMHIRLVFFLKYRLSLFFVLGDFYSLQGE